MKNKRYSASILMKIPTISLIFFSITLVVFIVLHILQKIDVFTAVLGYVVLPCMILFSLVGINRYGCIVWYDEEKKTINRKGGLKGFRYSLAIDKIVDIEIVRVRGQGWFIIIIDDFNFYSNGFNKRSFIRLDYNKSNMVFISQFWDKPINKTNTTRK